MRRKSLPNALFSFNQIGGSFLKCLLGVAILLVGCDFASSDIQSSRATEVISASQASNNNQSPPTDSPVVIRLALPSSAVAHYQPLLALFEEQNPQVRVEISIISDAERQARHLAERADVLPHSINGEHTDNALLDLRPLVEGDATFDQTDFWSGLLDAERPIWAIPTNASYQVIYFDKAAFDAAGLAYPELDWTIEEFLATAQTLTVRGEGSVVRWGYVPNTVRRSPLFAAMLERPLLEDGRIRQDEDVVHAVELLSALFIDELAPWLEVYKPLEQQAETEDPTPGQLESSGQAAMWQRSHLLYTFNNYDDSVGVATIPTAGNGLTAEPIVEGFAISRGTQHRDAAWQLVTFLSEQLPNHADEFVGIPARRSVTEANAYWETLPLALRSVVRYSAENNTPLRLSLTTDSTVAAAVTLAVEEHVSPAEVVANLATLDELVAVHDVDTAPIVLPTAEPVQPDRTVVRFAIPFRAENIVVLADAYNKQQAVVTVQVQQIEHEQLYLDQSDVLAGFDCFVARHEIMALPTLQRLVAPVDPLFELDPAVHIGDYFLSTIAALSKDGQLYAMPAWTYVPLLSYNRRLLSEAGLPEPATDWTLSDFLATAQALSYMEDGSQHFGYVSGDTTANYNWGLAQFRPDWIVTQDELPSIDYAATVPMLQWYADLVRLYQVQPAEPAMPQSIFDAWELIAAERVALWPSLLYDPIAYPLPGHLETGLVPFPAGLDGGNATLTDRTVGFFLLAESTNRQACWEWMKFLSMTPATVDYRWVPARIGVAQSPAFADIVGEERASVYLAAMANERYAEPMASAPYWVEYPSFIWLGEAYRRMAVDGVDALQAVGEAQAKFDYYRQCVITTTAFDDFIRLRNCAREADPDNPHFR